MTALVEAVITGLSNPYIGKTFDVVLTAPHSSPGIGRTPRFSLSAVRI
jgi:hypothetical protein